VGCATTVRRVIWLHLPTLGFMILMTPFDRLLKSGLFGAKFQWLPIG
jgi:hypothetical protein